jgi:hypothetical protein
MTLSHEEARDQAIAQRTEKHFNAQLAALCMGDLQLVASVDESLSHAFCDRDVMARLIVLAVTDRRQAGAVLEGLIHKVLRADAEVAALRDVEQMEWDRAKAADEERAEQVLLDRVH